MIRNYLLGSLRVFSKEKLYAVINTLGLAIGLATCFLIYSWVSFETSYDTSLPDSDRVYRVVTSGEDSGEEGIASTYPMVKTRILEQFPEIEASTRLFDRGFLGTKTRISYNDQVFVDNDFYYGDASTLDVFPFEMIHGEAETALDKPNSVILTRETAEKLFREEDPIGQEIIMGSGREFEVTAVIENLPSNLHFHFDLLASMQAHPWVKRAEENLWSGIVFHTYVKLQNGSSPEQLESKIAEVLHNFPDDPDHVGRSLGLQLQPVRDIHLKSNMQFELQANGNIKYIYLFVTIALLVLVVAIFNYTNLTTARHTRRFQEVGVRKVLGASRLQLITQFLTESGVITVLALVLALLMVKLAQPWLAVVAGEAYISTDIMRPDILLTAVAIAMLIGFLTGLAPALTLSSMKPIKLFKANLSTGGRGVTVRKVLVVSQFTVAIALMICTAITYKQVRYMQKADLGYDMAHTIVLNIGYDEIREKYQVLKSELLNNPSIIGATATSQLPTDIQTGENIDLPNSQSLSVNCISVDPDFFRVMDVKIVQGDHIIPSIVASDTINHFVINERVLKAAGWTEENAANELISIRHGNQEPGRVMGVVSNFHFQPLHQQIGALVLEFDPRQYQYLLVKVQPDNIDDVISYIENAWEGISPNIPFDYMFLDQQYDNLYKSEKRSSTLFIAFSIIAIFISLLGLFGLSAFAVERRTREIGLRKILGARNPNILYVLSKDFLVLLIISFVLSIPAGYFYMDMWLADFAFRTRIGVSLFIIAGGINILLGLMTLSYHGLRIAQNNPADTIRHE